MPEAIQADRRAATRLLPKAARLPFFVLLLAMGLMPLEAQAQFKWVGRDGVVNYSDLPPPPGTALLPRVALPSGAAAGALATGRAPTPLPSLAPELSSALRAAPVTLYTSAGCVPCDEGRALLRARGIPSSERRIETEADLRALQALDIPSAGFPVLVVGGDRAIGFESGQWQRMLDAAGYPTQSMLPRDWPHEPARSLTAPTATPDSTPPAAQRAAGGISTPARLRF